jgi:hypothetical protein
MAEQWREIENAAFFWCVCTLFGTLFSCSCLLYIHSTMQSSNISGAACFWYFSFKEWGGCITSSVHLILHLAPKPCLEKCCVLDQGPIICVFVLDNTFYYKHDYLPYLSIMNDKISFKVPDTMMTKRPETVTRTIITTHKYKPECDLCHGWPITKVTKSSHYFNILLGSKVMIFAVIAFLTSDTTLKVACRRTHIWRASSEVQFISLLHVPPSYFCHAYFCSCSQLIHFVLDPCFSVDCHAFLVLVVIDKPYPVRWPVGISYCHYLNDSTASLLIFLVLIIVVISHGCCCFFGNFLILAMMLCLPLWCWLAAARLFVWFRSSPLSLLFQSLFFTLWALYQYVWIAFLYI